MKKGDPVWYDIRVQNRTKTERKTMIWGFLFAGVLGLCATTNVIAQEKQESETSQSQQEKVQQEAAEKKAKEKKEEAEKKAKEKKEEKEKEEKQKKLEKDAKKLESKLNEAQEEKQKKQQQLNVQRNNLSKQRYELEKTRKEIESKEIEIIAKKSEIKALEGQIVLSKASLSSAMRQIYYEKSHSVTSRVYSNNKSTQFFLAQDHSDHTRDRIVTVLKDLNTKKGSLETVEKDLEVAKKDKEELLKEQKQKENQIAVATKATSTEVQKVTATISEINGKLAGIQSKLSDLLGVGLSTDDIVEAADFASKKTGVRKGLLLGMLIVETDLGRYTGGCSYKESRMNENRKELFKKLTKELGYNYKKMKVSCPPSNYKGTGGAMGVAQFMSDTWYGYKDVIAKRTGNNPPDPWNLVDGVMAMASKLANDGATKNGRDGEWKAAARYLGSCKGNTKFYCENVLYWADNYEKKL